MTRLFIFPWLGWAWLAFVGPVLLHGQVTTRTDAVGKLLNKWQADGTASGLAAITYENRDAGHSRLDAKQWPQLQVREPVGDDKGPANLLRPTPLLGNCSMSASATSLGSLPRLYVSDQQGFEFLARQYSANNHFIYPEHQDYDPGWNGRGGWGDLYPAYTPCLTISQGSSYTDQPFLRAFLSATAALPPDTQKLILQKELLAPTLQALLRRCYKPAKSDDDYLTGKAHPPVFDGELIDEEKMVRLAHEMTPERIPPVVRLQVGGESTAVAGKDFFEAAEVRGEALGTSPFFMSRIFRSSDFVHELLLSAAASVDVQGRALTFKWALLQGDLTRVRIESINNGAIAKVAVAWHPEMRAASGIQTHRVDIGVFAHNGVAWSAPAIVSFYMLPNEARFYDVKGRVEEICYDAGNPDPGLPAETDLRWLALGSRLGRESKDPGIALLNHHMSEIAIVRLQGLVEKLSAEQDAWRALSSDDSKKKEAAAALAALQKKLREGLTEKFDSSGKTVVQAFEDGVRAVAAVSDLYLAGQDVITGLVKNSGKPDAMQKFIEARQRLLDYRIFMREGPERFVPRVDLAALTDGEKHHLAQFHLTVLSLALLPELLDRVEAPAFVDKRLTTPKPWRDLHHYDAEGKHTGWTRIMDGRAFEFDTEGRLLTQGRTGPATEVKYERDEKTKKLGFVTK